MLIQALCDYYDELAKEGKVLPEGYSNQAVHYLIALTHDGKFDGFRDIPGQENKEKSDKEKSSHESSNVILPKRTEKSSIESNLIEHRPLYIFGLNFDKKTNTFTPNDKTNKAKKSHEAFVQKNLEFIEGLDSPIINAYRKFIENWIPDNETENLHLLNFGKKYSNSNFAFCLSENQTILLHEDKLIKEHVERMLENTPTENKYSSQCAITGEILPIARTHSKIKTIFGGLPTGTVLVGYKAPAGCSYCNEQSYNSNISEIAMKKYTNALNILIADKNHKMVIDDVTAIFWANGGTKNERCSDLFDLFVNDDEGNEQDDKSTKTETNQMLKDTFALARSGELTKDRLASIVEIDENIDFYIVGLKPNSSRLAVKFIHRKKFADILYNIARHQADMTIIGRTKRIPLWRLEKELVSPKSSKENADASLLSAIFKSILYGSPYPVYLLSTLVTRAKTDADDESRKFKSVNSVRAGAIRACINRKSRALNEKEELSVALDINNTNQAYLCGRLFAVLQKIQETAAAPAKLNRTIKDAYFSSAASKPALVFPKLISLSQNHMKKLDERNYVFFNKLTEEIISKLEGQFPDTLTLTDQGRFMIGYYHQDQDFYTKKTKED